MSRTTPDSRAIGALLRWYAREGHDLPWRRTRDRWAVLVSEVMLQSTQVSRVVLYYEAWMARWPTAAALAAAPLGDVLAQWQGLGYPRRARNLHKASAVIATQGWPQPDQFTTLPGVGNYTAAALRCFADGDAVLPEDVNVRRIIARRFPEGWPGTPPGRGWDVGQALMDLGREVCSARAPRCDDGCPVRRGCPAADAGVVQEVTPRGRRQSPYEGSLRQRRGTLLRALAEHGRASVSLDPEAAVSLLDDGLAERRGRSLVPVGACAR